MPFILHTFYTLPHIHTYMYICAGTSRLIGSSVCVLSVKACICMCVCVVEALEAKDSLAEVSINRTTAAFCDPYSDNNTCGDIGASKYYKVFI